MSLLTNIGFPVKNSKELERLAKFITSIGKVYIVPKGQYVFYRDASGAELWIQRNARKQIIGLTPFYQGITLQNLYLKNSFQRKNRLNPLDGSYFAIYNENDIIFPVVFDVPDYFRSQPHELPTIYTCSLVAFTINLNCFSNKAEFVEFQRTNEKGAPVISDRAFIPVGIKGKASGEEEPVALISGKIKKIYKRKNKLTRKIFYHIVLETLGIKIDVVASPDKICRNAREGYILYGLFHIFGRPLHPPF